MSLSQAYTSTSRTVAAEQEEAIGTFITSMDEAWPEPEDDEEKRTQPISWSSPASICEQPHNTMGGSLFYSFPPSILTNISYFGCFCMWLH